MGANSNPPTLRDIAAALDLSVATVSRALRDSHLINQGTRERVQQKAREMNYRPDPGLARLNRLRWAKTPSSEVFNLVFLANPSQIQWLTNHPHITAAVQTAEAMGYGMRMLNLAEFPDHKKLDRHLKATGVEGILLGAMSSHPILPDLSWERYSVVLCGDDFPLTTPFHRVRHDLYGAVLVSVAKAVEKGYRRIGLVNFPLVQENDWRRLAGYRNACLRHELEEIPVLETSNQLWTRFPGWVEAHRVDAVLAPNISIAKQFVNHLTPPELGVILVHDTPDPQHYAHAATSASLLGRTAAQMLSHALHHNQRGMPDHVLTTLLEPEWVEGTTLPPREP
jgi:DNA-binding LacI/PurR family transcriptional regulator